jgi:hypothetical protein
MMMMMMMKNQEEKLKNERLVSSDPITNPIQSKLVPNSIYVTKHKNRVSPLYTGDTSDFEEYVFDKMPEFISNPYVLLIPKGIKREIERLPRHLLAFIDKDRNRAKDVCLLVVSFLMPTILAENQNWKSLNAKKLHEILKRKSDNTYKYNYVLKALKYSNLEKNVLPIIEVKTNDFGVETFQSSHKSKEYRLHERFRMKSIDKHLIKDESILIKRRKYNLEKLNKSYENKIVYNLLNVYPKLSFSSLDELLCIGKKLAKNKKKNKKGKYLKSINKMSRDSFSNIENITFIEDNIKLFEYLTCNKLMPPKVGDEKSGGRVVDNLTLMPSWIRMTCKIDEEEIEEIDFKAFHPNIAMYLYNGTQKYISHQTIADELNIDVKEVKIEHLAFFNKRVNGMKKSVLYNYYKNREPKLLNEIIKEKQTSQFKHKITSMKMFALEVQIMTEIISRLNKIGIYVIYVYDALCCKKSDSNKVQKIMNEVVLEFGVHTTASL